MKVFTYDLSNQIDMTEEQYNDFINDLQKRGLLKEYLRRVYLKIIDTHKASVPEWTYGKPMFVRINENGLISIFFESFDEFFYLIMDDGSIKWCRKWEYKEVFKDYFKKILSAGLYEHYRERVDSPFHYFESNS